MGLFGFRSTPIWTAVGTCWRRSPSRFASNSFVNMFRPVALPPGRLRLVTRPSLIGSPHILAFDVAGFFQTLTETAYKMRERFGGRDVEKSDHGHLRLLGARRERPRR